MLGQRVVTAIVLLAFLLPALFASSAWPFAAVTLVFIAAAGWEWGRLNQMPQAGACVMGLVLVVACLWALIAGWVDHAPRTVWWAAAAVWIIGGGAALRGGPAAWPKLPPAARWLMGLLALWAAWLALSAARGSGLNFVLSIFCLVWVADIAAYFGGRAWGRRKLAPATEALDEPVLVRWKELLAELKARNRSMTCEDSLIAATALQHGHILATHNTRHFEPAGLPVIDPLA